MNQQELNHIVESSVDEIAKTLIAKGEEYADTGGDRLENFKQIAALQHTTPERALLRLVGKHIVALYDFARREEAGELTFAQQWREKTGDIMAYMVLLRALRAERDAG